MEPLLKKVDEGLAESANRRLLLCWSNSEKKGLGEKYCAGFLLVAVAGVVIFDIAQRLCAVMATKTTQKLAEETARAQESLVWQ